MLLYGPQILRKALPQSGLSFLNPFSAVCSGPERAMQTIEEASGYGGDGNCEAAQAIRVKLICPTMCSAKDTTTSPSRSMNSQKKAG
jgi:hypothetical protein